MSRFTKKRKTSTKHDLLGIKKPKLIFCTTKTNLINLPPELLLEVIHKIPIWQRHHVRMGCKILQSVVDRAIYTEMCQKRNDLSECSSLYERSVIQVLKIVVLYTATIIPNTNYFHYRLSSISLKYICAPGGHHSSKGQRCPCGVKIACTHFRHHLPT